MANSNSRNEYLQSLNRMRSNYQSSGNVLVNPSDNSTNVGTDISSFAYMNTPVQVPKQATKVSDESFYSKLVATGNEITGNVQRGFLDFVDGIIDAVVWGAGGVGKVFGGSDEWAKNVIEHDWQSQVILFSQQLNNAFRLDNFYDPNARENYIEGWSVLGDYQKSKEYLDQMYNNSYSQDLLGEKGQDVYQGLLQTVGNVLPSIAIGGAGLPTKVAQGVSLGTMGVSGFGSGTEQALQEGANYEQAGASGVISAGVETASELIPIPGLGNRIGNIGSKITNKTVKEIGKAMLEEGSEEVISELLSPLSQLPYKDISEIEGSSFGDLAMAFVGGAIGGGLGGGAEITRRNTTYSKKGADTLNLGMEISETIEEAQKEFQKGDKRDNNKMLEYQKQITEGTKLFKEQLEQIKLDDEKNGTNYYEKIVEVLKNPQSVTDYFDQSIEQREAKNVETQLSNLSNGRNVSVKIVSDQEYLSNPRNIGTRAYNITKTTTDGKTSTEIVIRESKVDKFYELVAHEGIAHGVIDLNKNAKRNIIDYVNSDKTFKKEFEEDLEKAKQLYKGESDEIIESEALARFLERYVKNSSSLSKITDSKAKKGIKKVLNNLKDYLSRNKLDKQANKLIKQINKAIDNIDKESVAFEPKLSYSKDTNKGENGYDFRKLQEESRRIFNQRGWKERVESFNGNLLERFSRIFRQEIHSWSSRNSNDNGLLTNTGDFKIYKNVDGTLFHDIFEISRAYLKNGELVDLHDNYNDSTCYLSDDGLSGFAITKNGDLISVFNLNYKKKGFLRAIAPFIKENAKTLDCYVLNNDHNLKWLYETMFGFKTASIMDYNMEYDHDDIAKNHNNPKVAFMVNTTKKVETKEFDKDSYDEAQAYQQSFISEDIRYSKELGLDDEVSNVKEAQTKTKQELREEAFPRATLVKYRADIFADKVVDLYKANEITNVIVDSFNNVLNPLGAKVIWNKNAQARDLFENYNLYSKENVAPRDKIIEWYDDLMKSRIEWKAGVAEKTNADEVMLLEDFVKLTLSDDYTYEQYKMDSVLALEGILQTVSKKSRVGKLKDYYNKRIEYLSTKLSEYQQIQALIINTMKEIKKLQEKHSKKGLKQTIKSNPKVEAILNLYNKLLVKVNVTRSNKGFAPTSVADILNAFEGFDMEILNDEGIMSLLRNDTKDLMKNKLDLLKTHANYENGVYSFKQGYSLKFDETKALYEIIGMIHKDYNNLLKQEKYQFENMNKQAHEEIKTVYDMRMELPKRKLTFGENISLTFASIETNIGSYFGYNSDVYRIVSKDMFDAHNKKLVKKYEFRKEFEDLLIKHNITNEKLKHNKLNKKVEITINGKKITTTYGELLNIYIQSLSDNGEINLSDGGYTITDIYDVDTEIKVTSNDLSVIKETLTEDMKNFGEEVLYNLYNGTLKEYKAKKDTEIVGFNRTISGIYYPKNKAQASELGKDAVNIPSLDASLGENIRQTKNMTWLAIRGMSFEQQFNAYIDGLTNYGEMYEATLNLQNLMNSYMKDDNDKSRKVLSMINEAIPDLDKYFLLYEQMITGQSNEKIKGKPDKMLSNLVSSTLFGNASVVLKQFASIPIILNEVSFKGMAKGIANLRKIGKLEDVQKFIESQSGILKERWAEHDSIKAQTLSKNLSDIAKIFGVPMEFTDKLGILTFGWSIALAEAEVRGYTGEAIKTEAINILNSIVANTQSNAIPFKMSPARAGKALNNPNIIRLFSFFKADFNNKMNYIVQVTSGRSNAIKRIKYTEQKIQKLENELNKIVEENATILANSGDTASFKREDEIKEQLSRLKKILQADKKFIDTVPEKIKKLLVSLFLSALMIAGIEQLVARLFGRKEWNWNEEDTQELITTTIIDTTIGNLPFVSEILNAIEYDTELTSFEFGVVNNVLDLIKKAVNSFENGELDTSGLAMSIAEALGYITGIPIKNLYNLIMGIYKNVSPDGYRIDNLIKGYSEAYVYTAYKEALQDRNYRIAKGNLELLLDVYKGGSVSNKTLEEMFALAKEGYNVTPTTNLSQYEDENGNVIKLTNAQQKEFLSYYNQATTVVNEMIDITDYNSLDSENKAKAIKKLYSAYYYYGKAKVTGEIPDNKLAQLLYYSNGQIDVAKYIASLQKIGNIQTTEKNSRKELILQELNKMRLSKNEKLLVLYLSGYKLSEENKIQLESYLKTKGINEKSLAL